MSKSFLPFVAAIALSGAVAAAPPLSLTIRVLNGTAPFTTRTRITVEPHKDNRWVCIQWTQIQGGTGYGSGCQEVSGASAPKTYWRDIKRLGSGKWEVQAWIVRNTGERTVTPPITLHVLGPNYEME